MGERPYEGDDLIGVCVALAAVQILIVTARFYTRYMLQMRYGLDDYLILVALAANLAKAIIYIVLVNISGLGYHLDYITSTAPQDLLLLKKGLFAIEILDFPFSVTPAKISLLLFYARIFTVRRFQIFAYAVASLVLVHGDIVLFAIIFQCKPIPYAWDKSIPDGTCTVQHVLYRFISPPNVLTGIFILVMPMPFVWRLHVPRAQKMALTGVFLLGGLGTVASILRMVIYYMCTDLAQGDVTWYSVELGILSQVESGVLVIAACLITIWPFITKLLPQYVLRLFSFGTDRERQHRRWYMRSTQSRPTHNSGIIITTTTTTTISESQDEIAHYSQDMGRWPHSSCSVSSSSSSLADLEDQRWSIFADEARGAEKA
ncbi:hypothetical protein N7510_005867 [Penicillium lagena]|uniref:uncharacterized protein n=1 Tax=Penicillium lagena TaxID=94218 RepID=UPI00253FD758|nr:uncharacterized protein N7510_005867 [Penicillium lagena]KAJ5612673.1 hypothetical protein N7510_005867 [Penicillium lagena]